MSKQELEKSLKRFLKRKLSYTLSLLISFLITGGFAVASELNKEDLLSRIKEDRVRLEQMLKENSKERANLQKNYLDVLKEADFYVKPNKGSLFSMQYFNKRVKHVDIEWQGSVREATDHDSDREKFNSLQKGNNQLSEAGRYTYRSSKLSSGWVNKNTNYGNNANAYDVESKLFILPVVKAPVVNTPSAPNVTFTPPTAQQELKIVTPTKINVQMGTITVTAPTVTAPTVTVPASITAPTLASVTVNEPNVTINIGNINVAGPTGLTLPSLTPPTVTVNVSPNTPPSIVPPNPQVVTPEAPTAPNFNIYTPAGGWWLSGWDGNIKGYNNFDENVLAPSTSALKSNTVAQDLEKGNIRRLTDTVFPLFSNMDITNATGANGGKAELYAYRVNGVAKTGYKNVKSNTIAPEYTPYYYPSSNPGITDLVIPGSAKRPGHSGGMIADREIVGQKNRWLFINHQNGTTIENTNFIIGGENGTPGPAKTGEAAKGGEAGVILTRNDGKLTIKNSKITFYGKAAVALDILYGTGYATGLTLQNVSYDFKGNDNTLYIYHSQSDEGSPWSTPEINSKGPIWGKPYDDSSVGKEGVHGKTNIDMNSRGNVGLVLIETTSYRWNGYNAVTNPQGLMVYTPTMNRFRFENKDNTGKGKFFFNGAGNIGAWLKKYVPDRTQYAHNSSMSADQKPILDLGEVYMNGDKNVGVYLQGHNTYVSSNAVYMGKLPIDFKIGVSLYGETGNLQDNDPNLGGNIDGDVGKTSGNVALYVASGQRKEMTIANGYFPATTDLKAYNSTNTYGVGIGTAGGTQIAYPGLSNPGHAIKNLEITDYKVDFGKYSKNNIAVVARNGSVVEINPNSTLITDGQGATTPDADRAEGTIIGFAEGVWWNPRPKIIKSNSSSVLSGAEIANGTVVTDGRAGQKYVPQYGSSVIIKKPMELGSKKAVAVFAKDGAKIESKGITIYGAESTVAFAISTKKWMNEVHENDKNYGGLDGTAGYDKAPSTIKVDGDIVLTNGSLNKGLIAINDGGDGASVELTGKMTVKGLAAFAKGANTSVTVNGAGSNLTSGSDGTMVALNGGKIKFAGGTITHDIAGDKLPFYSANGSQLTFTGTTTVNISKGLLFFGAASDFTAAATGTSLYNGMSNVTVNLKDHGVNLGVFKDVDAVWDGTADYLNNATNGLKNIPKVANIHTGTYWYKSSLDGGKLTIKTDVNKDSISAGSTPGDGFNDIVLERKQVILVDGKTVTSTAGRGMLLGSNKTATLNTESGYTIKNGTVDISNGANPTTGVYVNFGHIVTEKTATDEGIIKVSKGVAAYGVNGSKIKNEGTVKVDNSDATNSGVGIMLLAKTDGKTETYGIAANKAATGSKWMEIINKGTIDITGTNAIGIYAKNNHTAAATRALSTIHNEAPIELGDQGKAIVIQTTNTEGATLTLKDSGTSQDIKVGKEGIGVYAEYSDVKFDGDYGIAIKDDGIAVQAKGVGKIETTGTTDKLNVEYKGAAGKSAMALAYTGAANTDTFTNNINLNLTNTGNAKTLVGLYASGLGTLTNNGDITVENDGTYGILSKGVDIVNAGTVKVGKTSSTDSDALGIYVENAKLTTDGDKLKVQGNGGTNNKPIGIYVKENVATVNKDITINQGTDAMKVDGKKALGLYLDGNNGDKLKLINKSDIELTASAASADKRTGIVLKNAKNTGNITTGKITVKKNNIGIYNENSILTHQGTLEVKHDEDSTTNIGIHNNANGGDFVFKVEKTGVNPGLVDVEGRDGTVGISVETDGTNTGTVTLTDAQIKVKATDMGAGKIPLGIYAKGNKININSTSSGTTFTVSPNGVGTYLEGDATSKVSGSHKYSLSSENTADRLGIGTYFKGGSYATTTASEKIEIESTQTKSNTDGPIRPIGLFYGQGSTKNEANLEILSTSNEVIGMYGKNLTFTNTGKIDVGAKGIGAYFAGTNLTNTGKINATATGAYGLYLNGGNSNTQATITASGKDSVGALITGKNATFENKVANSIISKGDNSIGVYVEKEAEFKNSGKVTSEEVASKSIGIFADKGKVTNALNATIESKNVGIYAKTSSTVDNAGKIDIVDGSGIVATDKTTVNLNASGLINSATAHANGVIATDKTTVNLSGTNISLTGNKSTGIYSDNKSTVNLTSGDITIGQEGLGLYTNNGTINLTSYTGTFSLGNKSVGIYSKASTVNGGTLRVGYNTADIGVGIFYDGGTVTNNTVVEHTGKNLVNILSKGATLTNTANQNIQESSIGVYAVGGEVINSGTITLTGDKSVAFYLDNGAKLSAIGTINGTVATNYKVGIYAKNGRIEGTGTYNFAVDNGVAMYLDNNGINDFRGTLNMAANSSSGKRAVGIYTTPSTTARNIDTNINLTGTDSIGMLLSGNATTGSTVNYGGTLDISATSSNKYGIGAMVQENSVFNLTSTGKVKIGGANNIGFYVKQGGTLQVTGGTVENTKDGTFAYLENGNLEFKAGTVPNINYLNVSVSGTSGLIKNSTSIAVGTSGLQATDGAKILNTSAGTINAKVDSAKALVGIGAGTNIINQGTIKLEGKESVAMYVNDNAIGTSTGSVEVGKNSVAYFVKDNGLINVSGTTKIGEASSVFYINKGKVNYTGKDIVLPNSTTGATLIGTNSGTTAIDFNGKSMTVGERATGIYVTGQATLDNSTIQNLAKINVGKLGNGIYINNDNPFTTNTTLEISGEEGIGIYSTKNGNLTYGGKIDSTLEKAKGIVHTGAGDTINNGTIKLTGDSSIGAYAKGGNLLENTNKIEIAKGTTSATAVGLYGLNQATVKNSGSIKLLESSIGIYGENTTVINNGSISNSGKNNNGIYAKDSDVTNTGPITLGDSSNGIFATSTGVKTITNSGNITVGNTNSAGIFGAGKTGINNLGGTITVGKESVGLATKEGNINVASATNFNVGESSTYIYSQKGNVVNNANLALSDYSVGAYTETGNIQNNATITVGKSLVGGSVNKVSVGMATEKGTIINNSTINVPDKYGVGMVATKGGTAINAVGATINANGELSYGMQATNSSNLINNGTINVRGKDARGIAATNNSKILNTGTVNIDSSATKAQGIYVDFGSEVENSGVINLNSTTGVGILAGAGGVIKNNNTGTINLGAGVSPAQKSRKEGASQLSAGAITIKGPKAYIDNIEIQNSGVINVNGPLDLGTVRLGSAAGHIGTINAESFNNGKFIVLPNATLGSNKDMYTIQYLGGIQNVPNNGSITAISHSATFVADIQKDSTSHNITRIVLVRIPYTKLLSGTAAENFGKGLDDLYKGLSDKGPEDPEQKIFDALKMISNKDQLGATFDMELRGNTYANVQGRILDINENFSNSYENLKNSNLYARGRFKTGAIITNGNAKDKNPAVENYKSTTTGLIVMKEKDFVTFGRNANISLAFTETNFKFDYGSKEKVHSLQVGVGFENFITENNWKYSTRGEFTINKHNMKRKIHLSNGTYENKGKYWSETVEWKNKLRYEIGSSNGIVTAGVFGTFNLGYGKFDNIKENGDGAELEIKSKDMFMVRPGIGTDIAFNHYTKGGKVSLVGTATAEYEAGKVYDGVNQAKIKKSNADYYDLEKPKQVKEVFKVGAQVQYETNAGHKIGLGVTREAGSVNATKVGVNAVYKF